MADKPDGPRGSKQLAEITKLPPTANYNVEQALDSMKGYGDRLSDVVIIGYVDGELVVRSSRLSRAEALWIIEFAKLHAMNMLPE